MSRASVADRRAVLAGLGGSALCAARAPGVGETTSVLLARAVAAGCPGMAAAVADRRGVVWTGAAGWADVGRRVPLSAEDVFPIGSISKTFTAVVILQLAAEGRLSLDATAADVLGAAAVAGIANADAATLDQLLSHTGGVPSWEDDPAWIREGRGARYDPTRRWAKTDVLAYVRGPGHAPLSTPGAAFHYANTNYTLLGMVVERVAGRAAEAEIRRRVLRPLGLRRTGFEGLERRHAPRPRRYHYATDTFRRDAGVSPRFPEVRPGLIEVSASEVALEWTAGGMVSTVRELALFGLALRQGRLLPPAAMRRLMAWRALPGEVDPAGRPARAEVGHGLFRIQRPGGPVLIGHGGDVLGSTGELCWMEAGDVLVAVLANVGTMHAGETPPDAKDVGAQIAAAVAPKRPTAAA